MKSSGNRFLLNFSLKRLGLAIGLLVAISAFLTLTGCSTDVDVNAPYQTRAVIYGLLNPADSIHYIRVQKSFLNIQEPDAFKAARVKDSIYFPLGENLKVALYLEESNRAPVLLRVMTRVEDTGKDSGIFSSPDYVVYRYKGSLIPEIDTLRFKDSTRLRARYSSGTGRNALVNRRIRLVVSNSNGYQAIARTRLVYPIFDDEISNSPDGYHLITPQRFGSNRNLATVRTNISFAPFLNGAVYKILVSIPFEEVNRDGSRDTLEANWTFLSEYYTNVGDRQVGQQITDPSRKFEFFELLRQTADTTKDVEYRRLLPLRIRCIAADSALASYIQISGSFSAITQTKPFFTNVTNGLGLLASRTEKTFQAKADTALNGETMKTFNLSRFRSLKFKK